MLGMTTILRRLAGVALVTLLIFAIHTIAQAQQTPAPEPAKVVQKEKIDSADKLLIYKAAFRRRSIEAAISEYRRQAMVDMQQKLAQYQAELQQAVQAEQELLKPYSDKLATSDLTEDLEFVPKKAPPAPATEGAKETK
jgi:Na+/phosphate symporter